MQHAAHSRVCSCANEQWARDLDMLVDDLIAHESLRVVVGGDRLNYSRPDV